jgi:hypothetical protein
VAYWGRFWNADDGLNELINLLAPDSEGDLMPSLISSRPAPWKVCPLK